MVTVVISSAADQDMFDLYSLEVEGDIHDFITGDFDGDQLTDIVMVYTPINENHQRYAGLYLQKGPSGFRPRADYLVPVSGSAVQMNSGDIDGDDIDEIIMIDGGGVSYLEYTSGSGLNRLIRLIKQNTIYSFPHFHGIVVNPFVVEMISSNEGPEIMVPVNEGYAVYELTDDGTYQLLNQLKVPLHTDNRRRGIRAFGAKRSYNVTIELPEIFTVDGNGDDRRDLYFLWNHKLCTFFQDNTGNFSQEPDVVIHFFEDVSGGYRQSRLADCNGDSRPDIAASLTSGGITNTETTVRYYMADSQGRLSDTHSREINLSDSHCNLIVTDYDQDNYPEIVVTAVEMGAIAASKMFLLKKTDLHLLVYRIENGLPAIEPKEQLEYEFRFDFDHPNPTGEISLNWTANFNYDILHDAVFSDGNSRLLFYWGQNEEFLSDRPDLEVPLDHPSSIYPVSLNSGSLSDLIVDHNLTGRYDRLTILKNRNNNQ